MLSHVVLAACAVAQIKTNSPASLISAFNSTEGQIIGSTSTFGAPSYGESVVGRVVFREPLPNIKVGPHCTKESYSGLKELETRREKLLNANKATESSALHKEKEIFLVRRGGCSFVTKVRVAEELGADAVIVVDESSSPLTHDTIHTVIMADDGFGAHIVVPSILISYHDGQILEKTILAQHEDVILTLSWDVPVNDIVIMDLWMSSASKAANDFLNKFAPFAEKLSYKLQFVPRFHIYDLNNDFNSFCLQGHTFCADDPDGSDLITGKDVVEEDLRQLCLWHATAENDPESSEVRLNADKPSERQVRRSRKFWEYVGKYYSACEMSATKPDNERFGTVECSEKLMLNLEINVEKVRACVRDQGITLLTNERDNAAWSAFALRINGWRYAGQIEASLVMKAVCSGYRVTPEACSSDAINHQWIDGSSPGSGLGSALATIATICILLGFFVYCYHSRFFSFYVRRALQEEVMLEVQSQMAEYKVLTEDDSEDPRELRPQRLGRLPRWA